jgi:hypothetical protein
MLADRFDDLLSHPECNTHGLDDRFDALALELHPIDPADDAVPQHMRMDSRGLDLPQRLRPAKRIRSVREERHGVVGVVMEEGNPRWIAPQHADRLSRLRLAQRNPRGLYQQTSTNR